LKKRIDDARAIIIPNESFKQGSEERLEAVWVVACDPTAKIQAAYEVARSIPTM
jgi:hypothetical protein